MQQHKKYEWHTPFTKTTVAALWLAFASLVGVHAAQAQQDPPSFLPELTEQEERGKQIYYYTAGGVGCVMCHGDIGQGSVDAGAPAAAGANRMTMETAMDGGAALMQFFTLNDKEREDVWTFLQVLQRTKRPTYDPEGEAGKKIYEELAGGVGCQACHGMDAAGIIGPDIRGKDPVAILNAMKSVPDMGIIDLTEEQVSQVAAYLRALHESASH